MKIVEKEIDLKNALYLEQEINGTIIYDQNGNQVRRVPGFLTLKISSDKKYWLTKFAKVLKKDIEEFNEIRNELVKKLGREIKNERGEMVPTIEPEIDDPEFKPKKGLKDVAPKIENPKFVEFKKEIEKLYEQKEKYKVPCYGVEELLSNIDTEDIFGNIFEWMILEPEENY